MKLETSTNSPITITNIGSTTPLCNCCTKANVCKYRDAYMKFFQEHIANNESIEPKIFNIELKCTEFSAVSYPGIFPGSYPADNPTVIYRDINYLNKVTCQNDSNGTAKDVNIFDGVENEAKGL